MRLFCFVAILVAAFPGNSFAQVDPNWSQREMERMQAQQERWDAQAERQRAEQDRWAAQAERQRVQQDREQDQDDRQSQQYQTLPPSPERTQPLPMNISSQSIWATIYIVHAPRM